MKKSLITLLAMGVFSPIALPADSLKIEADGNYVFKERIELTDSSAALYEVSGTFTLTGALDGTESYIELGLAPFDGAGTSLQSSNKFSHPLDPNTDGYMSIAMLPMSGNEPLVISKRIQLGGAELKQVSFVVGVTLSDGAKVAVTDLKLTRVREDVSDAQTSSGISVGEGSSPVSELTIIAGKAGALFVKDKLIDIIKEETLPQNETSLLSNTRRTIYVNADIGSDNFAGFKRLRGQADGPKRTLFSAFKNIQRGDEIVLQKSIQAFVVTNAIKPKSGETITIRAEGDVVIKGSR
jgi:hypothetical protein